MAKSKAETPAKKPRAKKAAPAVVSEEQAAPASGAEAAPETPEAVPQATALTETIAQPEAPEEVPATGGEAQAAPEEGKAAETAPKGCPAVVRAPKGLNLRIGPALNYEVLEVLPDGAEVTAMDMPACAEVPGWRLVCTQNGAPAGAQRSGSGGESRREWSGADVRQRRTESSEILDGEFGWVQSRFLRLLEG